MVEIDPAQLGHRDMYKLMIGSIVPRPIAFVSTLSTTGVPNLAPFSFFQVVSSEPPMIMIAVGRRPDGSRKDTAENAVQTGELVVNIVDEPLAEQMNLTSGMWLPEIDEFEVAGLTPAPSVKVRPARVAESRIHMECRLAQVLTLGVGNTGHDVLIAEIVHYHVDDALYDRGRIDHAALRPIGRLAGDWYIRTSDTFAMRRPETTTGIPPARVEASGQRN